jgi:hypothetical protein
MASGRTVTGRSERAAAASNVAELSAVFFSECNKEGNWEEERTGGEDTGNWGTSLSLLPSLSPFFSSLFLSDCNV